MLQSSEYSVREYLIWYRRTKDFTQVAKRKELDMTIKARLLLAIVWAMSLSYWLWIVTYFMKDMVTGLSWAWIALLVWLQPRWLAYGILIPLQLARFLVQYPVEFFIIRRARRKLWLTKAIKIAIAGSYGKTTFKETLAAVIGASKRVAATPGNINTPLGISRFAERLRGDEDVMIFELGEYFPGDIRRLCRLVHPNMGVITGVNEAHLEKFKTLQRTAATIFELAQWLGNRRLYVNGESSLAKERAVQGHILYSRQECNEWKVSKLKTGIEGTSFTARRGKDIILVESGLLGLHQVGPLLAVIDICVWLGIPTEQIEAGLRETKPFQHRLQPKSEAGVVTIDDSYNGNPDGAKAAVAFLRELKGYKRLIYITPGLVEMGDRTEEVHRELGRELADAVDQVMLIRNSVTPFMADGLKEKGFKGEVIWFSDGPAAYASLPQRTVSGDVVLMQNDWPDNYA